MEMQQSYTDPQSAAHFPRTEQDLVYVQTSPTMYVVKNVQSGRYFKLNQNVVHIMQLLDGATSAEKVSAQTGLALPAIHYVLDQLARLDLLESEKPSPQLQTQRRREQATRRWGHHLIFIRKNILTSDRWMDGIYRRMRLKYLFHPVILLVLLALSASAGIIVNFYQPTLVSALHALWRPGQLPLHLLLFSLPVYALLAIPHELAHGFACKHFGGRVRAIGVGLYYFQPAFFCDVSDAWLFTRRYQRVVTHAAGLLANLFCVALAILLIPFVIHIGWLMEFIVSFAVVTISFVILNLNPLIQLDGYYILADALGIDNLRTKAFTTLFSGISFALSKILPALAVTPFLQRPLRERIPLFVYALLSISYTIAMLWYLGTYYGQQYIGNWSWLLSALLISLLLLVPLWRGWKAYRSQERRQGFSEN